MSQPRLSAIITTYNCAQFVGDAITSVLSQTRPPDEFIIVDDGSSDATPEIIQGFSGHGIQLIRQENQGPGGARNTGMRAASGDLIAFLDCDDIWLPHKTELQTRYLQEHPEDALVGAYSWWWDLASDEWRIKRRGLPPGKDPTTEILVHNFVGNPSSTLFRRQIFEQVGLYDLSVYSGEDWELWMRILREHNIGFLPEPLLIYRWYRGNRSHENTWAHFERYEALSLQQIKTHAPWPRRPILSCRARAKWALTRAWHLRSRGASRGRQLRYLARALIRYPGEDFSEKIKLLISISLGTKHYRGLQTFWRQRVQKKRLADQRASQSKPDLGKLLKPAPGLSYSFLQPDE